MKLVIATEIFPPDIGGPATYSKKIAEELVKKGWGVKLICYSTKIENDDHSFPVTRILRGQNTLNRYWQYFWNLLKIAKDANVIYAQGPVSSGLPAIVAGFFLSKKVIVKIVGDYAWEQARNLGQTEIGIDEFQKQNLTGKIAWLKKIEKWVCSKASKVIVPSQYLKKIVIGWGVEEEKIEVIYNAIDVIDMYGVTSRDDARKKFDFEKEDFIVISIGRSVVWKGFGLLALIVAELKENAIPNIKLRILGVNHRDEIIRLIRFYKDSLIREIHPLVNSDKRVEVLRIEDKKIDKDIAVGSQPKDKVYEYLLAADLFVLNTGYEGLPHTVLEAMTFGVPVITTNIGGNPEVVNNEYNGLLVEYNDEKQLKQAILKLYNNQELRQKFVQNSKEVLKKFSFEEMITKTINILKSI